jgi:phosphatidate phosphatase APP1
MALFVTPPLRVRPYFGYRNATSLRLTARALRSREPDWQYTTTLAKMRALFSHFASREVPGVRVALEVRADGGQVVSGEGETDGEGFVHFDLALGNGWALPETTSWQVVTLRWHALDGEGEVRGHVLAPASTATLGVISDIDDTILETGAHDLVRNWRRVLAQMPGERLPVPGARAFYDRLGGPPHGGAHPARHRPFFYVSSSPWNLFDYLLAFKQAHDLPLGPMMLRDWGLNRATLGGAGHGAHKALAIAGIAGFYPDMRFALIGDSTQADALAFAEAVKQGPERIAGAFLRKAPGAPVDIEEQRALDAITAAGVPVWLGEDYAVEEAFLAAMGFSAHGETHAIVEAARTPASALVKASDS